MHVATYLPLLDNDSTSLQHSYTYPGKRSSLLISSKFVQLSVDLSVRVTACSIAGLVASLLLSLGIMDRGLCSCNYKISFKNLGQKNFFCWPDPYPVINLAWP